MAGDNVAGGKSEYRSKNTGRESLLTCRLYLVRGSGPDAGTMP